jgi:hypothetical protein
MCVSFRSPSPHIYSFVQGCYGRDNSRSHLEPTLRSNEGLSCARSKAVVPRLVRPNHSGSAEPVSGSAVLTKLPTDLIFG